MDRPLVSSPLTPTLTGHLFPQLGQDLLGLLTGLEPAQWELPTVCSAWRVRDIAAHLLDTACRRLSFERDDQPLPETPGLITDYGDLVAFLDRLNANWVGAFTRVSPRVLVELLAAVEPPLAAHLASVDPMGPARFPVSWAGEEESRAWFDVARELTERWLHQQQIRLAVGAARLTDPGLNRAVFDTFLRALPNRYTEVEAEPGTRVSLEIEGQAVYRYRLERRAGGWVLERLEAPDPSADANLSVDETTAWLVLTKGMKPDDGFPRARSSGPDTLLRPFFDTVAVMA